MNLRLVAITAAAVALAVPVALSAQAVVPVTFARGTSSVTLNGAIVGYAYRDYRINVRAGQTLEVSLRSLGGSPYFNIIEPGAGDVALYNSSMGDQRYSGTTRQSGGYVIRVYQMRATARRNETARFALNIAVRGGTATQLPGDALVPGTSYNATSIVPCKSTAGPMRSCNAGVIRRRGTATVHLDTPDGGERTILFRGTTPVSSDGHTRMTFTRRGDTSVIRIGTIEVYEIPDALIVGG